MKRFLRKVLQSELKKLGKLAEEVLEENLKMLIETLEDKILEIEESISGEIKDLKKYENRIEELAKENLILKEQVNRLSSEVIEVDIRYKNILRKVDGYLKSLERGLSLLQSNSLIDDLKTIIIKKK